MICSFIVHVNFPRIIKSEFPGERNFVSEITSFLNIYFLGVNFLGLNNRRCVNDYIVREVLPTDPETHRGGALANFTNKIFSKSISMLSPFNFLFFHVTDKLMLGVCWLFSRTPRVVSIQQGHLTAIDKKHWCFSTPIYYCFLYRFMHSLYKS